MSQRRTCSYGHQWQSDDTAGTCPVCSSSGDIFSDSASVTPGSLDELPPPPEPQQPASDQTLAMPNTWSDRPATSAGRYRIVRPHARGGLGEVFVAEDTELGRKVALKEIQAPHADLPESRTRFVLEAQITGGLEHPGIVPVYGLGSYDDGRPYYAMRFVQGESLRSSIRRFHGLPPSPGFAGEETGVRVPRFDGVEFRKLLGQFVAVCQAVAYAHSRGILHRDLKPDNVMLGKFGETLVVDWGLAKVIGRGEREPDPAESERTLRPPRSGSSPSATAVGQALGTPTYMSPEQADGQLDELGPPADIYSLGATLYELLTGRPPFAGSVREVFLQIRRGEIVPPRRVQPAVPPPLEAVCLKAMAVRPGERYPTAQELAADVERWLADEPVSARRERVSARLWRWVKRHRMLVTGLSATVLVGLVSLGVATALLTAANERERSARERAVEARNRTRDVLDAMVSGVTGDSLAAQKALSPEQRKFLENVLSYYEKFAAEPGEDRQARERLAKAHHQLGMIHSHLGHKEEAARVLHQGAELFSRLAEEFPTVAEYRERWAAGLNNWAIRLRELGRVADAETAMRQGQALIEQLAADFPSNSNYRAKLASGQSNLALLLLSLGKQADAEVAFRQALAWREKLAAEFPNEAEHRENLRAGYNNLGVFLMKQLKWAEAEAAYRQAIVVQEKLVADFPAVADYRYKLATTHKNLGGLLIHLQRWTEAEAAQRQAHATLAQLVADFPGVPEYNVELATSYVNFGVFVRDRGDPNTALDWFARAIGILEPILQREPRLANAREGLWRSYRGRAKALLALQRVSEGFADWDRALQYADGRGRTEVLWGRADALARAGQSAKAAAEIDALLPQLQDAADVYDSAVVLARATAAAKDDTAAADRHGARAVAVLRQAFARGFADIPHMLKNPDLDPLRRRGDYVNLLWDLAERPPAAAANP